MTRYFDHNATTPPAPAVVDAVSRALTCEFGNASSIHRPGQQAKAALDTARSAVANLLHASPGDIIFTSGGTEADNAALRGAADVLEASGRRHLIATAIEHEAVLNTLKALAKRGWRVTLVPVGGDGLADPDALAAALTDDTALVSVMHANNEVGTVQPVATLAELAHARGALVHTDAVQSVGKIAVDVQALGVDLVSLSGHKFYGPKGVGALWVRRGVRLTPFMTGGRQERSRRAGTENVPSLVGLGAAAQLAAERLEQEGRRLTVLRDRLENSILERIAGTSVNGARDRRVPNTSNISFDSIEAESLLIALDLEGFAVSTGSACSSGTLEPSHVLRAMGLPPGRVQGSIRFSLGASNTEADVDALLDVLPRVVARLRGLGRSARS